MRRKVRIGGLRNFETYITSLREKGGLENVEFTSIEEFMAQERTMLIQFEPLSHMHEHSSSAL